MTAIAAITTGKFTVIASDTMYSAQDTNHYATKLIKGEHLVFGGAGESGPLWRNIRADKTWLKMSDIDAVYLRTLSFHKNIITDKQFDAAIHDSSASVEDLIVVSKEKILVIDSYGAEIPGMSLDGDRAYFDVAGSGRTYMLGYLHGRIASMSPEERRKTWRSHQAVTRLLEEAHAICAKYVPGVGGPVEVIVLK